MPLMLLLLTGVAGYGTGVYMNKAAADSPEAKATFFGFPASPALTAGGALLAVLGSGWLAPLGLVVAVASAVSGDASKRAKEGLDALISKAVAEKMAQQIPAAAPAPPILPGPAAAPPAIAMTNRILDLVAPPQAA